MKWIFLFVGLVSFKVSAIQQFTEAECLLIKQQVSDYKRRLGTSSSLYLESMKSLDNNCKNPIPSKGHNTKIFSQQQSKQESVVNVPAAHQLNPIQNIDQANSQSLIVVKMLKPLLPIFIFFLCASIAIAYFKKKLPEIKGRIGERHVINGLVKHLNKNEYVIANDVTLPLENGGTTQVDHIVVSRFGVFVIETKNMTGWIFGNENQAQWTQTIHRSKHQFQNPLRQNYKHTKTLALLLDMPHTLFHSVVVFTQNAELKTKMPDNVGYLQDMISYIKSFHDEVIDHKLKLKTLKLIDVIKLRQGRKTNKEHVSYLNEQHKNN